MIRCIAIDDEPFALGILEEFCRRVGNMEIQCFTNPLKGIDAVRANKPDILFLDIEMGGISGLELAREIPAGTSLIFTTAYAKYAIDGFELEAVDFLHKPFSFQRFEKSVRKAEETLRLRRLASSSGSEGMSVTVRSGYRKSSIPVSEIDFIESMGNYIIIHMASGESISSLMNLGDIMEMLPDNRFIRIHRSYIVQTCRIASHTSREVVLNGGKCLPVGRKFRESAKQTI